MNREARPCLYFFPDRQCQRLFIGLPDCDLNRMQRLQNAAVARLVCLRKRHESITSILQQLHWLPVSQRIAYKTLLITFKITYGLSPRYLQDLITLYTPSRRLRSPSQIYFSMLHLHHVHLATEVVHSLWLLLPCGTPFHLTSDTHPLLSYLSQHLKRIFFTEWFLKHC